MVGSKSWDEVDTELGGWAGAGGSGSVVAGAEIGEKGREEG